MIRKPVTKYSYATHLLELGVELRYIPTDAWTSQPETTMIYTHVSTRKKQDMVNPFNELVQDELKQLRANRTSISSKGTIIPENILG